MINSLITNKSVIIITEDRFRKYDELEDDEKEVLDVFRQMKLLQITTNSNYTNTKLKI